MAVGQVYYTGWCDEDGKLLDDGTVSRLGRQQLPHDVGRAVAALAGDERRRHGRRRSREVTDQIAALSLQGPKSRAVLNRCCKEHVDKLKYFRVMQNSIGNMPVSVSRTGYTGDLGYEIWIDAEHALPVWDALMDAGDDYGITPCGILRDGHGARRSGPVHDRCRLHRDRTTPGSKARNRRRSRWAWTGP